MEAKLLGEIEKNSQTVIRVSQSEYLGQVRIDIRLYWAPGADPSELVPSKKGINLSEEQARELGEILNKIS